ncbi:MAG: Cof-type HAD-IIB family hydrolase [Bacillota bacterium]
MIKLIAIDLDDTLLNTDRHVSPRNREAIRAARERGVMVTLATGRMYQSALPYAHELGLDVPLITYQGALIKTALTGEELFHRPIPLDAALTITRMVEETPVQLNIYVDDELYVSELTERGQSYASRVRVPIHPVGRLSQWLKKAPTKIVIVHDETTVAKIHSEIQSRLGDRVRLTCSWPHFLEISHPDASKGQALAFFSQTYGISSEEMMACGDGENDLDMISYAGLGVVMGNGQERAKRVADYITKTNDEDGVAEAIEKFVLKQEG